MDEAAARAALQVLLDLHGAPTTAEMIAIINHHGAS